MTSHGLLGQAAHAWSFDKTCSPANGGVRAAARRLYTPGTWNRHLSDDVAAFALAHNAADRQAPPPGGEGVPKTSYVSRSQRERTCGPNEPTLLSVGDVRIVEAEDNPYIIC
jgi:hypothetical protein